MLYQYVKRYLKHTFHNVTIEFKWTELENLMLLAHIEKRYTDEELDREISEVKEAFKDFFEPVGKIIFRYKKGVGIKIKVFPYHIKPQNSKHLQEIVAIIRQNRKYIEYPFQGQNDQIALFGRIRREINRAIYSIEESVNTKDLIKYAIKKALDLQEEDIITQLKRKYIIKIFSKKCVVTIEDELLKPTPREGIANRFNGYTAQQIEETYKEVFHRKDADIDLFLENTMKTMFKKDLNFRVITNQFYQTNSLKIIHSAIAKELSNYFSLEKDYLFGLSGFIMRKFFQKIHELMAIELIACIYDKDTNATNFLLHYNGSTVLIDNKKYKIPALETEDGRQWNNATLIGICNLWMNTKKQKEQAEIKLAETEEHLKRLNEQLDYIKPDKEKEEKVIDKILPLLMQKEKIDKELNSKLKYLKTSNLNSTEYFSALENAKKSNSQVMEMRNSIITAKVNLRAIKDTNASTYTDLEFYTNQKQQLMYDLQAQSLNINAKHSQIDPILRSITQVLIARTKCTENRI